MSHFTKNLIGKYIPLWKRKIPKYPIYWKGDPQLRVFLPLFWMKLLKPKNKIPSDRVQFEVHPQMSTMDVKNYLEKIYKVPVTDVKFATHQGEPIEHPLRGSVVTREDDKKIAFVVLGEGQTFEFPGIFDKPSDTGKQMEDYKVENRKMERANQKLWDKLSLPPWFR
ncbi:hypothetical protein SNE40_018635 [Patella caerulea]|uniref:Large ribosomal subunit protein uL23m n=1 Tax=Patella caerulea TaxID=87958 RepID=A0AAN8PGW2_PATCE